MNTKSVMVERIGLQGARDLVLTRSNVGHAKEPVLSWVGSKTGYLWVGDGDSCLFTLSTGEARRLMEMLQDVLRAG